jgi:hypothetical protein
MSDKELGPFTEALFDFLHDRDPALWLICKNVIAETPDSLERAAGYLNDLIKERKVL